MYVVTPPAIEKQYLFLSPLITTRELPEILNKITENGITILDIQKIDYSKFEYDSGDFSKFNKDMCLFKLRGTTYNLHVGYVMKLARENLTV
jgi:hypothetical protein